MSFRVVIIVLIGVTLMEGTGCYQPFALVRLAQGRLPGLLFYVPTRSNCFALTFDDGPNPPYTDEVLAILERYGAKATFFLIGSQVEKHPGYLEKIRAKGHQVANHLYVDRPTISLKNEEFVESLERTEGLINQTTPVRYFRPAGGWITREMVRLAREQNYQTVIGSAYVFDTLRPPRWYMRAALKAMLRPGAILVLHDGGGDRRKTVDILPDLLEHAKKENLIPVTLHDLIQQSDFTHR